MGSEGGLGGYFLCALLMKEMKIFDRRMKERVATIVMK